MKWNVCKAVILSMALLAATTVLAANKRDIRLNGPTVVSGKSLPAGEYTVSWEGQGNVEVSILQRSNVVAKVPAKVIELSKAAPSNTYSTTSGLDGSLTLKQIQFGGKKYALDFGSDGTTNEAAK